MQFEGVRPADGPVAVFVVFDDGSKIPLPHDVWHSPTGFEWGYGGSGPADLARSLCRYVLGSTPRPGVYQHVKSEIVAKLEEPGFVLPATRVLDSIARATGKAGRFPLEDLECI